MTRLRLMFRLGILAAILGCVAVLLFVSVPAASADSGFCGVRAGDFVLYNGDIVYEVRNKCIPSYRFSVRVPLAGFTLDLGCQTVPGEGFAYYTQSWPKYAYSPNWYIVNC